MLGETVRNFSEVREGKGKGQEGSRQTRSSPIHLYREHLQRDASILADRQMTRSIARACQTDGDLLRT
jgi:hypothetical protein